MERFDEFYGEVVGCGKAGIYILGSDHETYFSFSGQLPLGSKVLCSFEKDAGDKKYSRVVIVSVINYGDAA